MRTSSDLALSIQAPYPVRIAENRVQATESRRVPLSTRRAGSEGRRKGSNPGVVRGSVPIAAVLCHIECCTADPLHFDRLLDGWVRYVRCSARGTEHVVLRPLRPCHCHLMSRRDWLLRCEPTARCWLSQPRIGSTRSPRRNLRRSLLTDRQREAVLTVLAALGDDAPPSLLELRRLGSTTGCSPVVDVARLNRARFARMLRLFGDQLRPRMQQTCRCSACGRKRRCDRRRAGRSNQRCLPPRRFGSTESRDALLFDVSSSRLLRRSTGAQRSSQPSSPRTLDTARGRARIAIESSASSLDVSAPGACLAAGRLDRLLEGLETLLTRDRLARRCCRRSPSGLRGSYSIWTMTRCASRRACEK